MWILTQGTNTGIPKIIGDAVHNELLRRQALLCHKHPNQSGSVMPPLTLMGVAREDLVLYGDMLDGRVCSNISFFFLKNIFLFLQGCFLLDVT